MTTRGKRLLLALLLSLGALYRLTAAYPIALERFAPASSALQAMHILDGWRPIFYSGQAWMGPAGAYILAGMFKLFGASSLTLGAFSWVVSVLFLLTTVLLARRLFGIDNALVTAGLFLVPIDYLMQLSGQPRAHYTIIFVLVPVAFLLALSLVRRHREGRSMGAASLAFGFFSGFCFWTNMAIGPAVAISMLLLLLHLRRAFFTRLLAPWAIGYVAGFSPVIWYNLTNRATLSAQVNAGNAGRLGHVFEAFVTNAWPHFWGVDLRHVPGGPLRWLLIAVLTWVAVLFAWALAIGVRRWLRGEDTLGYQLVFGYLAVHLGVTMVSSYGRRFETSTPLSYVGPLFAVAFCIPALVLQSRVSRRAKTAALLPFAVLVANNLVATAAYPRAFFAALREDGLARVTRYPNEDNPFLRLSRERGLDAGYLGRAFGGDGAKYENFRLNLECFGSVTFADLSSERYVDSALKVDASRRICWVGMDRRGLKMIGATADTTSVGKLSYSSDFRRDARELSAIDAHPSRVPSRDEAGPAALTDKNFETLWEIGPKQVGSAGIEMDFGRPEQLRQIVLFPADVSRSPGRILVETSLDGVNWSTAMGLDKAVPMFWSVWHPYLKQVKPRLEIVLQEAAAARFCRLSFVESKRRDGIALREALFLRDGPVIPPAEWEREIDEVVQAVRARKNGAVVVGDHWFVNFFRREGFATDFISNETVTDTGNLNPNLAAPVPLDLSRPLVLVVQRAFQPSVERSLRVRSVPFSRTELRHHVVLLTEPSPAGRPLYWNGLEINELARRPG